MQDSKAFQTLSRLLSRFPGLGPRSAKRMILYMLTRREEMMQPLAAAIAEAAAVIRECPVCGNLDSVDPCSLCRNERRDKTTLCVVQGVSDIWALERTRSYYGQYHVLGGLLSALDGVRPENLRIASLLERAGAGGIAEIIMALPATVDGQSTAHYIQQQLRPLDIQITRLAHGVPVGGELDYLDEGTLSLALRSRSKA